MRQPKWRDLGNGRIADVDRLADEGSIPSSSTGPRAESASRREARPTRPVIAAPRFAINHEDAEAKTGTTE